MTADKPTVTPLTAEEALRLNRMERGRDLTDAEMSDYLANRQTAIRHGTADIGTEIAEHLRDRLAAHPGAWSGWTPPWVLDAARTDSLDRLREFAEDVIRQFGYWSEGAAGYTAGGLSTLEDAFTIAGWDDPHPVEADDPNRCDEPKCRRQSSSGWPTRAGGTGLNGGYRRTCHEHTDYHQNRECNWPADSPHFADAALRAALDKEPKP